MLNMQLVRDWGIIHVLPAHKSQGERADGQSQNILSGPLEVYDDASKQDCKAYLWKEN